MGLFLNQKKKVELLLKNKTSDACPSQEFISVSSIINFFNKITSKITDGRSIVLMCILCQNEEIETFDDSEDEFQELKAILCNILFITEVFSASLKTIFIACRAKPEGRPAL